VACGRVFTNVNMAKSGTIAHSRPRLVLFRDDQALAGRLNGQDGSPLPDIPVSLSSVDPLSAALQ